MNKETPQPNNDENVQEETRQLVMARVRAISKDVRISIGSTEYTKDELLKNIEQDSEVGREVIETQMQYLRDLASGAIYVSR